MLIVLYAVTVAILLRSLCRPAALPPHLLHHPVVQQTELISEDLRLRLVEEIKDSAIFPSNAADTSFYEVEHEHIGEAVPIRADGTCEHPLMLPNKAKTLCILPGRIDIAKAFMITGGYDALKNTQDLMISRIQSFGRYNFGNLSPVVERLFDSDAFQEVVRRVCPTDAPFVNPFQSNYIIQVPGQAVPVHIDGVYFWGASRFVFPQWLLAVMKFSGLFEKQFVPQVQIVGYLHRWEPTEQTQGEFIYWNDDANTVTSKVKPIPRSATGVDGSTVVHAATVYQAHIKPPRINKDMGAALVYKGDDLWEVRDRNDGKGAWLRNYTTDDLRISIVYRGRCFKDAEQARLYSEQLYNSSSYMSLEHVLDTLAQDLIKKGSLTQEDFQKLGRFELAELLLATYVPYPSTDFTWTSFVLPFNYCVASVRFPWLKSILSPFCTSH